MQYFMIINEDFFDDIDPDIINTDIEENEQLFNRRLSLELNINPSFWQGNS